MSAVTCPLLLSQPQVRRLLRAASRAPSPDNNQPWAFRIREDGIEAWHDRERAVPSDVENLFAGLAMGAAIENVALEASQQELRCEVEYAERPFAQGNRYEPVATLRLAAPGEPDRLGDFIDQRTTNRRLYETAPLANRDREALSNAFSDPECQVNWLTSRAELRALSRLVTTADRIRFEYQPFHDELHRMLRFGRADAPTAVDGLDVASLEIPRAGWPLLRWLKPWRRMKLLNHLGLSRLFAGTSNQQIRCSGAVGLLLTRRRDAIGAIQTGRVLQRIWLAATGRGLAFQPVGALPLFLRKLEVSGEDAYLPHHARRLVKARDEFRDLFPPAREELPVILFRVGHCAPPSARSGRYPVDAIELP